MPSDTREGIRVVGENGYRVATWNLWGRLGDEPEARRPVILQTLRQLDPDVVGLQEIWADDVRHDAAELADELGYEWAWVLGSPGTPSGNAVLSRWPIRTSGSWLLPSDDEGSEGSRERKLLMAEIETPYGDLPFFTTHLTYYPHSSGNRCDQVRALMPHVAGRHSTARRTAPASDTEPERVRLPPILCGDFNALPESDEIRLAEGVLTEPVVPGFAMADAWRWAEDRTGGTTWDPRNPHVASTGEPAGRIDYVLCGRARPDGAGWVRTARLFGDDAGPGDVWPSDHVGVVVDLSAPTSP